MPSRSNSRAAKVVSVEDTDINDRFPKQPSMLHAVLRCLLAGLVLVCVVANAFSVSGVPLTIVYLGPSLIVWIAIGLGCKSNYAQDFDATVEQVAQTIHGEEEIEGSPSEPLLLISQPRNRICYVEDRQFGITDKKSGKRFVKGTNIPSVLRLNFAPLGSKGCTIQGTRSATVSPSQNYSIQKGYISISTRKAYWVENCSGIQRVVNGQFDLQDSFSGEWLASDGSRGSLLSINRELSVDYAIPVEEIKVGGRGLDAESSLESTNSNV